MKVIQECALSLNKDRRIVAASKAYYDRSIYGK